MALKYKESRVEANLIDILRGFNRDIGSLVMDISRQGNVLISLGDLGANRFQALSLAKSGSRDPNQFTPNLV